MLLMLGDEERGPYEELAACILHPWNYGGLWFSMYRRVVLEREGSSVVARSRYHKVE